MIAGHLSFGCSSTLIFIHCDCAEGKMKRIIIITIALVFVGGSANLYGQTVINCENEDPCEALGYWPVSELCEHYDEIDCYWMPGIQEIGNYESKADCIRWVQPIFTQCCNKGLGNTAACWCKWLTPEYLGYKNIGQCVKALTREPFDLDECEWNPHCKKLE